ncbi:hypothetical protein [Gloeobacter morelensis]|uniref:hypothetical protein n=1 Tax=Gloeobacter morelensis TaxID=2907343 RepID=UPI001E322AF8|nr:hypothetical protein [Gloeobacter morelensis]UFP97241.1 hypothetical protein ISF26_24270 [Gloeobacter morelensis MG652769]
MAIKPRSAFNAIVYPLRRYLLERRRVAIHKQDKSRLGIVVDIEETTVTLVTPYFEKGELKYHRSGHFIQDLTLSNKGVDSRAIELLTILSQEILLREQIIAERDEITENVSKAKQLKEVLLKTKIFKADPSDCQLKIEQNIKRYDVLTTTVADIDSYVGYVILGSGIQELADKIGVTLPQAEIVTDAKRRIQEKLLELKHAKDGRPGLKENLSIEGMAPSPLFDIEQLALLNDAQESLSSLPDSSEERSESLANQLNSVQEESVTQTNGAGKTTQNQKTLNAKEGGKYQKG